MRRPVLSVLVLVAAVGLVLAGCIGDEDPAPATTDESAAPAADGDAAPADDDADDKEDTPADEEEDAGDDSSDEDGEVASGILLQLRGQQLTASIDDSQAWSCSTAGDGGFASVMFLDDEGNDVSIDYDEFSGTAVAMTLADGTAWDLAEDGVLNVVRDADGTYRMSLQVIETSSGETEAADVRLSC